MNKIFKSIILLVSQFLYVDYFFSLIEKNSVSIITSGLVNISNDLSKIGFSSSINISIKILSFTLVVFNFVFIFYKYSNFENFKDPVELIKNFIYLFFINTGSIFAILYLFRFYNFSRFYLILQIILFPIFTYFIIFLLEKSSEVFKNNKKISYSIFIVLLSFLIIGIFNQLSKGTTKVEVSQEFDEETLPAIELNLDVDANSNCYKWSGSNNFSECLKPIEVIELFDVGTSKVTNFVNFNDNTYIVFSNGVIKVLRENSIFEYLDISEFVKNDASEAGLYDIAFHPVEDYFLISYSNLANELVVKKINNIAKPNLENPVELINIPNSVDNHYCGSIEWSDAFGDFLLCVGDMGYSQNSIDTSSQRGKIILINKNNVFNSTPLISESNNDIVNKRIIAYGLRNPWNFKEHNGLLIIPDVGEKSNEELNIVDLTLLDQSKSSAPFFGWPLFEGSLTNENKNLASKNWSSNEDGIEYLKNVSIKPVVYYDRPAPENVRAAILGTVVINDSKSAYYNKIIFSDYISKEIFIYDHLKDELKIISTPNLPGYITAIEASLNNENGLIFSTVDYGGVKIFEIILP